MDDVVTLIRSRLPEGLDLPPLLADLLRWIGEQGWLSRAQGEVHAHLADPDVWPRHGTDLSFHVASPEDRAEDGRAWFGGDAGALAFVERLIPFARTGGDGSRAAFWRDHAGRWRIVHLGSGSGSLLTCVLADTAEDFLRLVGIGYDELCWLDADTYDRPPGPREDGASSVNAPLLAWLADHGLVPPRTASEIVVHPATMDDEDSPDPFCAWLHARLSAGA